MTYRLFFAFYLYVALVCNGDCSKQVQFYNASVVEHAVLRAEDGSCAGNILNENLVAYEELARLAGEHRTDILVFPEFGLCDENNRTSVSKVAERIPELVDEKNVNPCLEKDRFANAPILSRSSCMARGNNLPLLVNMVDLVACSPSSTPTASSNTNKDTDCPSDGHYLYNTNVVFSSDGTLAAKYHKSHEWPTLIAYDMPNEPDYVVYTAPFGVQFGLFTCFDIFFQSPALDYVDNGISHFLYPVKQGLIGEKTIIESWSARNNATVLSANLAASVHDCSGIIASGKTLPHLKYYLNDDSSKDNIIISRVEI